MEIDMTFFRLRFLLGAFVLLMSLNSCKPQQDAEEMEAYLMVYFKDDTHSLYMAISEDGYVFSDVNDGFPVAAGDTLAGQKGIRDPHITRGPDGAFYLAMTDLHIFGMQEGHRDTQWERPQEDYDWGNNRGFVLMKSFDLIHWTHTRVYVEDAFPQLDVGCAWAPQTIYDPEEDRMMLYFTMRLGHGLTGLYYAYTNDDFTQLDTEPQVLFEYPQTGIQILDADITPMPDGRYCMMYVVQERQNGIKMAFSDKINQGYEYQDEWVNAGDRACEAPNLWPRIDGDSWVLMYDIFGINPHNFGFVETSDFKNFTDLGHLNKGVMQTTNFEIPKHGAVMQVSRREAEQLREYW